MKKANTCNTKPNVLQKKINFHNEASANNYSYLTRSAYPLYSTAITVFLCQTLCREIFRFQASDTTVLTLI